MSHKNCPKRLKNRIFALLFITSILTFIFAFLLSGDIYAQTSDQISLQGKIVRNDTGYEGLNVVNGTPSCVASGADTCDFQVKYYDAATSGTLEYTEEFTNVEIGDYGGVFNLSLGSVTGSGNYSSLEGLLKNESTIYIQIEFAPGGSQVYSEVFSRTALNASAYSIRSKYAEGSINDAFRFYNASTVSSTVEGSVYYDTNDSELKLYNGSAWVSVGNAGASAWGTADVGTDYNAYMSSAGIGVFTNFTLDTDDDRLSIHSDQMEGGLTVYSSYSQTGGTWPLVSFKAENSGYAGSILELTQDGTGDILQGYSGSTFSFQVDRYGDVHLANNGVNYFEPFAALPGSGDLHPNTGEGCLYSSGGSLYWDSDCSASSPTVLGGGTTLWSDGGTFTYLTQTTDDLVLGASTPSGSAFFFDVSTKRLGIGTSTPQASIDIAGATSNISNTSGDITITPNQNLIIASGNVGIGTTNPTASLHIKAGTTVAGTAPIKFTAGTNLTTPESGAMEWDGNRLYITNTSPTRNTLAYTSDFSGSLLPAGTEGQMLYNNAGTWTGFSGMYWDDTDSKLGIGNTSPTANLSVQGSITGGLDAQSSANNNFTFGSSYDLINKEGAGANDYVYATATQSDGKMLIGGDFTRYADKTRQRIARLNSDGSLDTSFDSGNGANDTVRALAIQSDGKILIGGGFTNYGGTTRQKVARLNSNGSLDVTFNSSSGVSGYSVYAIAIQSDGKILIGGNYYSYGGTTRQRIARLNSDGSLDTSFDSSSGANDDVLAIAIQSDGKILIGGEFITYGGITRQRIARLNSNGTLDTTFDSSSGASNDVLAIALQSDGKILIGGYFTTYGGTTRQRIARLNSDGSLDTTFDSSSGASNDVLAIALQSDGKILIGGEFITYGGTTRQRIARLNSDGSLDTTFDSSSGASSDVNALSIQSDGKILIGGYFTTYGGTTRQRIARLNSDGSLDVTFIISGSGANDTVRVLAIQSDGKILIGGDFTSYAGVTRQRIARLNSDGSLDTSFDSSNGLDSYVYAIAIQPDGKILVGGAFTSYGGTTRQKIVRLNSDGSLDTAFNSSVSIGVTIYVNAIALQSDGKILIGGTFTSYGGTTRQRVARLNSDGTLDTGFDSSSGADNNVYALAIQSDGKILIGGWFTSYGGTTRQYIARLNSNGSLDTTFNSSSGGNNSVRVIAIQSDGKILIGGDFTSYAGTTRQRIARLNSDGSLDTTFDSSNGAVSTVYSLAIQTDGKILAGGTFIWYGGTTRQRIARLNSDGSLDTSFDSSSGANSNVLALAIQSDGKILIGGYFQAYEGYNVSYVARIYDDGSLVTNITLKNTLSDSFVANFGFTGLLITSSESRFKGVVSFEGDNQVSNDNGSMRYNTSINALEFSNNGINWIPLGDISKTTTLSSEYAGAVLAADGSNNIGFMTSDAEGTTSNSMNYYEWNSSETSPQDYDVRLRFTIPSDFASWGTNAFTLHYATEAAASTNNKVDIYVYEEGSGTVDDSSVDQYSSSAGVWQTTNIQGGDLGDCNAVGETCLILIRMYSANDNYVRIGDIDVNYNRKL